MRKLYLLLLLCILVFACHPNPPSEVCGDNQCTGSETPENCPADCKAPPTDICGDNQCTGSETPENCPADCRATAICGDGVCNGDETSATCPADCEEPPQTACKRTLADKTRWLTYGHYGSFNADDPSGLVDYDYLAQQICETKPWTGVSWHLLSPWEKTPGGSPTKDDWPYEFKNGGFDGTKLNPLWFSNRLDRALTAFGSRGLDVEIALLDQYCCGSGTPQKWHPWAQNNVKQSFEDTDSLYSSLGLFIQPVVFHHVAWKDISEPKLQFQFSLPSPMAKMMDLYFNGVTSSVVKAMKAYPNLRVAWKLANETRGGDKKVGDRSEMFVYIHEMFEKKGLIPSKRFFQLVDREYVSSKDTPSEVVKNQQILHSSVTRPYGVSWGLGAILELHGQCTEDIIDSRINVEKSAANKDTLFSNDGNRCSKAYTDGPTKIIKANHPWTDIKMEESWTPFPAYKQGDANNMLKRYTKLHLALSK